MRLIDANAVIKVMQQKWENNEITNSEWILFREILGDAPTIPAIPDLPCLNCVHAIPHINQDGWCDGVVCKYHTEVHSMSFWCDSWESKYKNTDEIN